MNRLEVPENIFDVRIKKKLSEVIRPLDYKVGAIRPLLFDFDEPHDTCESFICNLLIESEQKGMNSIEKLEEEY